MNVIQAEMMVTGELNCCLWWLVVCIQRIEIAFRDTDAVSLVGEVKLEIFEFNF